MVEGEEEKEGGGGGRGVHCALVQMGAGVAEWSGVACLSALWADHGVDQR